MPSRVGFTHFRNCICFPVYLLHMYGRDYNQLYGCMWASGWACAPNVASLLWSSKSEQSERGCTSLPLQRLRKWRQRWRAVGVRVEGESHWARSCNLSTIHAKSLMRKCISFVNPLTLWQKDYTLILCLDDLQEGPISVVRADELQRAGRAKQTNE